MTHLAESGQSISERMLSVIRQAGAGIVVTDAEGNIRLANPRFWEIVGRPEPEGCTTSAAELTHPDDVEATRDAIRGAIEARAETSLEKRYVRPDGSVTWARASVTPVEGIEPGEVLAMAVVTDITAERETREGMAGAERRYRALLEATPAMVVVADARGRASFTNEAWEAFTGLEAADGPQWAERGYIHPDDVERATVAWEEARAAGEGYDIDYRVRRKQGQYSWVALQVRPVKDDAGAVLSWTSAAIEIDERVRIQEALVASEARLRALIDATPAMVVMTDASGGVQSVSNEWTAFTGLDAEAMSNWRELDTIHPEDAAATEKERSAGLRSRAGYNVDYRLRRADGEYRWVSATVRPALDARGGVLGWMFVAVDVDDRVQMRERLEQINADLRQLAESIPAIVITAPEDPAQRPFANRLWTEYTGIPLENVTQETIQRLIHREDAAHVLEAWERTNRAREPYEIQFRLRGLDGAYRWFSWRTQPLFDASQQYLGWITAGVEVDDQVRLREELEVTNEHLRVLADAGHAISDAIDSEAAIAAAGDVLVPSFAAWCAVDIVEDEAIVRKVALHSPEVDEGIARILRETPPLLDQPGDNITGVVLSGEGLLIPHMPSDLSIFARSPGHRAAIEGLRPNSSMAVPLRAVGGRTLGALSLVRAGDQPPFTEQDFATILELGRRLASALDRSRLFTQVARALGNLRLLADAGLVLSGSRELEEALDGATRLLVPGYADWCTVDLLEGDTVSRVSLVHSPQVDESAAAVLRKFEVKRADMDDIAARIVASGEPLFLPRIPADMAHIANRGPEYQQAAAALRGVSSIGVPLVAGDIVFGVLGLMRAVGREPFDESDLALARELGRQLGGWLERGRLFSDLRQALSAKDEFFGFVSHELKTPLTTVVGVSDVLSRRYAELDEAQRQDAVSLIRRDSLRLEQIIANMLTLARSERQTGDEPALVQHVIGNAVAIHRQRHPHRQVEIAVGSGLSPVLAPAGWIDRVVENLLSNAEKYSEPGTPIRLEAEQARGIVEVRVLDHGRGISEEQMRDVFEPFFRADPNEPGVSGVGLGLTVCRRLVERLGGEVWLGPREGGGTVAGFRLPVMDIPED